jgi:signal transduction histidine kinase
LTELDPTENEDLRARLAWITAARLAFLVLLLSATTFFYLRGDLQQFVTSQGLVTVTIGAGFALAIVYAVVLSTGKHLRILAYAQILFDQATWTIIVYVSGGATSGATSFYGLTCLLAAILLGRRGAVAAAVVGFSFYFSLCMAFLYHWVEAPADQLTRNYATSSAALSYPILTNGLGIVVVTMLAGYLAHRLKRTGGALELARERAEQAERLAMLGRIAAGLAHEIRNPLGAIAGSIEMLRESPALSAEDRRLCDIVHRESDRLNSLVTDMVEIARHKPPEPQLTDIARLAQEVVSLARHSERAGAGDVTVRFEGPDAGLFVQCDSARMRQLIWNLVRNGVQASPPGKDVLVSIARADDRIVLVVRDRGPGVPEDSKEQIFDAFFTTRSHGTGIGLAVVKRVVDDHGGKIEVVSPEDGGAEFRISLSAA